MEPTLIKLSEIISKIELARWKAYVFCTGGYPFDQNTLSTVISQEYLDKTGEDIDNIKFVKDNDLKYVFNVAQVQDIVSNSKQQKEDVSLDELISAFNYYFKNDAFINLS